jgi:hypothetical protein
MIALFFFVDAYGNVTRFRSIGSDLVEISKVVKILVRTGLL